MDSKNVKQCKTLLDNINTEICNIETALKDYDEIDNQIVNLRLQLDSLMFQKKQLEVVYYSMLSGFSGDKEFMNVKD
jgi:regulator of sirC expression with transglutaminase-like and TPR domain